MSSLTGRVAIDTAATAVCGCGPAVRQTAIASALRQRRQLRQGCLISCEGFLVSGIYRQINIRQLRETLPTLPALPFRSNSNRLRTAGCCQDPARAAVNCALKRYVLHGRTSASRSHEHPSTSPLPAWVTSSGSVCLQILLIIEALARTCGRDT